MAKDYLPSHCCQPLRINKFVPAVRGSRMCAHCLHCGTNGLPTQRYKILLFGRMRESQYNVPPVDCRVEIEVAPTT